jgi:hypothetical protein
MAIAAGDEDRIGETNRRKTDQSQKDQEKFPTSEWIEAD